MRRNLIIAIWLFLLLASMSARAHHSFSSIFDREKPITMTGLVTDTEWANPHIHLYIDVKDETGKVINWAIEMGSPNFLIRLGWTRHALKIGDGLTIEGHLARDGSRLANARTFSWPARGCSSPPVRAIHLDSPCTEMQALLTRCGSKLVAAGCSARRGPRRNGCRR